MEPFEFIGANLGGQMVFVCFDCGALVLDSNKADHTRWHSADAARRLQDIKDAVAAALAAGEGSDGQEEEAAPDAPAQPAP